VRRARACSSALSHDRHVFLHGRGSPYGNTLSGQRRARWRRGACGPLRANGDTR
jgi:hypothetical protein